MAKQQSLLPLILLLIFISVGAAIGYVVWNIATDIATKASQQMEAKHIKLGKDGVRIEIKELNEEDYVADTQSLLVKAWNYSSWPAYKSRIWNKQPTAPVLEHRHSSVSGVSSGYART